MASCAVTGSGLDSGAPCWWDAEGPLLTPCAAAMPPGGRAVHDHQAHGEPVADLHGHVPHPLPAPAQGEPGGACVGGGGMEGGCAVPTPFPTLPQQKFIATIPLVMYLSGFCSSFLMKPVNRRIGRNVSGHPAGPCHPEPMQHGLQAGPPELEFWPGCGPRH